VDSRKVIVKIDGAFKRNVRGTALGCVTAHVEAGVTCRAHGRAKRREAEIQKCRFRVAAGAPQVEATRAAYKALGKESGAAKNRGSRKLLRRWRRKGSITELVNVTSCFGGERLPWDCMTWDTLWEKSFFAREIWRNLQRHRQVDLNLEDCALRPIPSDRTGSATSDSERTM